MQGDADFTIGKRIKLYRERLGMKQRTLGELVGKSANWAYKVENDILPIDRLSVLIQVARVLKVRDLSDLTGGMFSGAVSGPHDQHEAVPAIRAALSMPTSLLSAGLDDLDPGSFGEGVADAWRVYETQEKDRYAEVGNRLPTLLRQGYATLRRAGAQKEVQQVTREMLDLYGLHQLWLRRVGEPVLARVVADRGVVLADGVGDPALLAVATWNLACVLTSTGQVGDCVDLVRETIARCAPGDDATPEHLSAIGALHLQAAVAAVRDSSAPAGYDHLRAAQAIASRLGSDRNDHHMCFGPNNVAMHGVHLAAEEGDTSEALRLADTVEINPSMPLERRTRYLIEVMNCNRTQRDDFATVYMLRKVSEQSPEEALYSPLVREAVTDLLKREKPTFRADLRQVAQHIGVIG